MTTKESNSTTSPPCDQVSAQLAAELRALDRNVNTPEISGFRWQGETPTHFPAFSLKSRDDSPAQIEAKCEMSSEPILAGISGSYSWQTIKLTQEAIPDTATGQKSTDFPTASEASIPRGFDQGPCQKCLTRWFANEVLPCPKCQDGGSKERYSVSLTKAGSSALSLQEGGNHYRKLRIQPVEYIHANGINFIEGCIIKYVTRWRDKGGLKDLNKAKHFIDILIELEKLNGS